MKKCSKCLIEKPLTSEYWHKGKTKDGFKGQCKVCRNAYNSQKQREQWQDEEGRKKIQERSKKYYEANKEQVLKQMSEYRKTDNFKKSYEMGRIKWVAANKDKLNAYQRSYTKKYKLNDRGRMIRNISHYKSKTKFTYGEIIDNFTIEDWYKCKEFFQDCCAYCGIVETPHNKLVMEHLTPLSKTQDFGITNIICSCHRCNTKKKQMDLETFYYSKVKPSEFSEERYAKILEYLKTLDS